MGQKLTVAEISSLYDEAYPEYDLTNFFLPILMPWLLVFQFAAQIQIWWKHKEIIGTLLEEKDRLRRFEVMHYVGEKTRKRRKVQSESQEG